MATSRGNRAAFSATEVNAVSSSSSLSLIPSANFLAEETRPSDIDGTSALARVPFQTILAMARPFQFFLSLLSFPFLSFRCLFTSSLLSLSLFLFLWSTDYSVPLSLYFDPMELAVTGVTENSPLSFITSCRRKFRGTGIYGETTISTRPRRPP